jgi:hypothetical protein
MPNVVAFWVEVQRVRDFIDGEEDRALCKLLRDHTYKAKEDEARIVGEKFVCCFGKELKKRHQGSKLLSYLFMSHGSCLDVQLQQRTVSLAKAANSNIGLHFENLNVCSCLIVI